MARFLPKDEARAAALRDRLSKTIFRDAATFVEYYNNGMINRNFNENKEIAKELIETFKDVKERRGRLGFISEDEVLLEESLNALAPWTTLVRLKRELSDLLEEEVITPETVLSFTEAGSVVPLTSEGEEGTPLEVDKLKNNELEYLKTVSPRVRDILALDTSFVTQLHGLIPRV